MYYDLFFNRRKNLRLPYYNYSTPNYYFVTICVKDRECIFDEIIKNEMKLSEIGKIVKKHRFDIPRQYFNIELDEYITMPNHIHGIIFINDVGADNLVFQRKNIICY